MATMQNIVDEARVILQDSTKVRYTDAELLKHANAALAETYSLRPDLFFSTIGTHPAALALGGTFPLSTIYEDPVAMYAAGRTEVRGDAYSKEGRGPALMAVLSSRLKGA